MKNMTCNKCGIKVDRKSDIHEIGIEFSYGEFDNQIWKFWSCTECLLDMVEGFEKPPEGFMASPSISRVLIDAYKKDKATIDDIVDSYHVDYQDYEKFIFEPATEENNFREGTI